MTTIKKQKSNSLFIVFILLLGIGIGLSVSSSNLLPKVKEALAATRFSAPPGATANISWQSIPSDVKISNKVSAGWDDSHAISNEIGWTGAIDVNGQVKAARYYDDDKDFYMDLNSSSNVNQFTANDLYANSWFRVNSSGGIYWQTYGGGWQMYEGTAIRSINDKNIYTGGDIYTPNVAMGGNPFSWGNLGAGTSTPGSLNYHDSVNGNPNLWLTAQDAVRVEAPNGLCINGVCKKSWSGGGGGWGACVDVAISWDWKTFQGCPNGYFMVGWEGNVELQSVIKCCAIQ